MHIGIDFSLSRPTMTVPLLLPESNFRQCNLCSDIQFTTKTRKRAIAKALQLKGHSDFAPVDLAYYQHFLSFLFENIAFWEVLRGNHKRRSRGATPLVNNKLESVQLQKHCISNAERHCARRYGFFGPVWFENITFERFAKCAWQPPCGADPRTMRNAHARFGALDALTR